MKPSLSRIALLLAVSVLPSWSASIPQLESTLQHKLMAPCCYGGTIDQHNSDAANQMKIQIHEFVLAGRSEREILDYYKARFGTRILAEPEGPTWWFGTLTPLIALFMGAVVVTRLIRKWTRPAELSGPA